MDSGMHAPTGFNFVCDLNKAICPTAPHTQLELAIGCPMLQQDGVEKHSINMALEEAEHIST